MLMTIVWKYHFGRLHVHFAPLFIAPIITKKYSFCIMFHLCLCVEVPLSHNVEKKSRDDLCHGIADFYPWYWSLSRYRISMWQWSIVSFFMMIIRHSLVHHNFWCDIIIFDSIYFYFKMLQILHENI